MLEMDVKRNTPVTLYWKGGRGDISKDQSVSRTLLKRDNEKRVYLRIPAAYADKEFVLQIGDRRGLYHIRNMEIRVKAAQKS